MNLGNGSTREDSMGTSSRGIPCEKGNRRDCLWHDLLEQFALRVSITQQFEVSWEGSQLAPPLLIVVPGLLRVDAASTVSGVSFRMAPQLDRRAVGVLRCGG